MFFGCVFCQNCLATPVNVKYIIDGDTFVGDVLLADGIQVISVSIRIRNVDTPEIHGNCESEIRRAEYAKQRLSELLPVGSTVEIKKDIKKENLEPLENVDENINDINIEKDPNSSSSKCNII